MAQPTKSAAALPAVFIATVLPERDQEAAPDRVLCELTTGQPDPAGKPGKERQSYACAVPSGSLSVRIGLPSSGVSFLWGVQVPTAGVARAALRLPAAVTLSGEVSDLDVVATLLPRGLDDSKSLVAFAGQTTELPRGGAVRFDHVAPGAYAYRLENRDGASSQAMIVVPESATEVRLPELKLPRTATLNVQITPSEDGNGQPWTLRLLPRATNDHALRTLATATDPTGWQSISSIEAGEYLLFVEDSDDSLWLSQPVHVEEDQTLDLEIPRVKVEGRATRGDDPFVGKLIFGGAHGSRKLTMVTDEDGTFAGFLPEEGRWEVEIASEGFGCAPCDGTGGSVRIPPVDVEKGPSGKAHLDIEIPDTKLSGRVVVVETDPAGETVRRLQPGATVFVTRVSGSLEDRGRQAQIWSDDGKFELLGLEPGDLRVGAMLADPPYESDWIAVHVEEGDEAAPPIELVLHTKTGLAVQLSSPSGPVGGATVTAIVTDGKSEKGLSGPDGIARLELPPERSGTLLVTAPGYGLDLAPFQTTGGSPAPPATVVALAPVAGSMVLSNLPYDVFKEGALISERGGVLPLRLLPILAPGTVSFGGSITIEDLAPGTWKVCTSRGDCWQGTVLAGTRSELDLSEAK